MTTIDARVILLVEDSPEDYATTERALRKAGLSNPIYRCEDGDEALDYLYRRGRYTSPESAPRPAVVLLDLNLPGTDGREVLDEIKQHEDLRVIPVIVLTTSTDARDIDRCYRGGANSYTKKPVDLTAFVLAMRQLKDYWFEASVLPNVE